jgi:hypothetical protein
MTPNASAVVLALEALDTAASAGRGMETGDEIHQSCRSLVMGDPATADLMPADPPPLLVVVALRDSLLVAAQMHAVMLVGRKWETVSEPWEDRETTRGQMAHLAGLLAESVVMASALGVSRVSA